MPKGYKPIGSGRQKGQRNKNTLDIRSIAKSYAPRALEILQNIAEGLPDENQALRDLRKLAKYINVDKRGLFDRLLDRISEIGTVPASARKGAADSLLDRGVGRPREEDKPSDSRGDRLHEIVAAMQKPVESTPEPSAAPQKNITLDKENATP